MAALINYSVRRLISNSAALRANARRVEGPSAVSGGHEGIYENLTNKNSCHNLNIM